MIFDRRFFYRIRYRRIPIPRGQISIPGANLDAIKGIFTKNQLLVPSAHLGGSAENFSIILMGLSPYINASNLYPTFNCYHSKLGGSLSKRKWDSEKFVNILDGLQFHSLFFSHTGTIILLNTQSQVAIVENIKDPKVIIPIMLTITTGTILLMWLGELISEKGIGNGISILIFRRYR